MTSNFSNPMPSISHSLNQFLAQLGPLGTSLLIATTSLLVVLAYSLRPKKVGDRVLSSKKNWHWLNTAGNTALACSLLFLGWSYFHTPATTVHTQHPAHAPTPAPVRDPIEEALRRRQLSDPAYTRLASPSLLPPVLPAAIPTTSSPAAPVVESRPDTCNPCSGPQFLKAREFMLIRQPDSHFYAQASIAGITTRFMVDTGATAVSLPLSMAQSVGAQHMQMGTSSTANGLIRTWNGIIPEMTIEGATLQNVQATFLPNYSGPPLLGQSALKQFNIEQRDDRLFFHARFM